MPAFRLTYFDSPGRAEPIRVALFLAKLPFEDRRLKFPEFMAQREQGAFPLGAVPIVLSIALWWALTHGPAEERVLSPVILPAPGEVLEPLEPGASGYARAPRQGGALGAGGVVDSGQLAHYRRGPPPRSVAPRSMSSWAGTANSLVTRPAFPACF